MDLNRNMTNEEVLKVPGIKEALDNGKLVIVDKVATSRPEFTNLYFIGKVEGLSSSNTNVSQLAAALLGWGDNYSRSIQNADTNIANQFQIGATIDGAIRVIDSYEPAFDGQSPRVNRNGEQLLSDGRPVYRSTQICTKDELNQLGHSTIEVKAQVVTQPQQPVNQQQQTQQPVGANVGGQQNGAVNQSQGVGNEGSVSNSASSPQSGASVGNLLGGSV